MHDIFVILLFSSLPLMSALFYKAFTLHVPCLVLSILLITTVFLVFTQ